MQRPDQNLPPRLSATLKAICEAAEQLDSSELRDFKSYVDSLIKRRESSSPGPAPESRAITATDIAEHEQRQVDTRRGDGGHDKGVHNEHGPGVDNDGIGHIPANECSHHGSDPFAARERVGGIPVVRNSYQIQAVAVEQAREELVERRHGSHGLENQHRELRATEASHGSRTDENSLQGTEGGARPSPPALVQAGSASTILPPAKRKPTTAAIRSSKKSKPSTVQRKEVLPGYLKNLSLPNSLPAKEELIKHLSPEMTWLFYNIASVDIFENVQRAVVQMGSGNRGSTSNTRAIGSVRARLDAIDSAETLASIGMVIRRYHLSCLCDDRDRKKQELGKTHGIIDELMKEAYGTEMSYGDYEKRKKTIANRLSEGGNWQKIKQKFNVGVLALIPTVGFPRRFANSE